MSEHNIMSTMYINAISSAKNSAMGTIEEMLVSYRKAFQVFYWTCISFRSQPGTISFHIALFPIFWGEYWASVWCESHPQRDPCASHLANGSCHQSRQGVKKNGQFFIKYLHKYFERYRWLFWCNFFLLYFDAK